MNRYWLKNLRRKYWQVVRAFKGVPMLDPWFDVRTSLAQTYGRTLIVWAENAMGYPPDSTHEQWTNTLRTHGKALLEFAEEEWDTELGENSPVVQKAQEAFRWTADNLLTLWD